MTSKTEMIHPIIFKGAMVRAILDGQKTQTRRVVKPQPDFLGAIGNPHVPWKTLDAGLHSFIPCPYGQPGDRLWVRETIFAWGRWETRFNTKKGRDEWHFIDMTIESGKRYRYPATMPGDNGPRQRGDATPQWWKRPAIHAPRVSSRILLENVAVRVERLQDISADDSVAEGSGAEAWWPESNAKAQYQRLWESINGPGSWDANPWVWVVEFRRA